MAMTSGVAAFRPEEGGRAVPFVRNVVHQLSEYIDAFGAAGLQIERCIEPPVTEEMISTFPTYPAYPDATRDAFLGAPYLVIWQLRRP
jgi:hypothetical protein